MKMLRACPMWTLPTALAAATTSFLILLGRSFWYDEAYSVVVADQSIGGIMDDGRVSEAVYSVGYYLLLHGWSEGLGFGWSEPAVRTFTALCSVASVPVVYAIARRLHGERAAFIAGVLMAVSPFFVEYGSEARQYGLVLLASSVAVFAFLQALDGSRIWLAGFLVAGVVAMGAHWFAGLVLIAVLAVGIVHWRSGRFERQQLTALVALAAVAVLPSASLAFNSSRSGSALDGVQWIEQPTLGALQATLEALTGGPGLLMAPALVMAAIGLWRSRQVVTAVWLLTPLTLAWVLSYVQPMFVSRYLFVCLPPMCIAVAAGISTLKGRVAIGAGSLVLAVSLVGVIDLATAPPKEDWASISDRVAGGVDPVVLGWWNARRPFGYYVGQKHPDLAARIIQAPYDGDRSVIETGIEGKDRVWLITTEAGQYNDESERARVAVEVDFNLSATFTYPGAIIVGLYERDPAAPPA